MMQRLTRLAALATMAVASLAAPAAAIAADPAPAPVACTGMVQKVVCMSDAGVADFLGPFRNIYETAGFYFIIAVVLVATSRLVLLTFKGLQEMNKEDAIAAHGEEGAFAVVKKILYAAVQVIMIAAGAYLIVTSGPSILLSMSTNAGTLLDASCADVASGKVPDTNGLCLISNLGPFKTIAWTIQTWTGRGIAVFGAALWAYKWFQALRKVDLKSGADAGEGKGGSFSALKNAFENSSAVALGTVIGYIAIMRGPDLIYSLVKGGAGLISTVPTN